ncbi:MAG: hypothetical protein ABI882_08170, partial [Acidobacteriota bacterium]
AGNLAACAQLKEFGQAVVNLSACQFKLASVGNFTLAGISLAGKTGLSLSDAPKALAAFSSGSLPASFSSSAPCDNLIGFNVGRSMDGESQDEPDFFPNCEDSDEVGDSKQEMRLQS